MSEEEYDVVKQDEYGFRRLSPVPSDSAIEEFYDEQYYDLVQKGKRGPDIHRLMEGGAPAEEQRTWQEATLYADVSHALSNHAPGKRVLEIGCGTGDLLLHLEEQGFEVSGVEIAKAAADFAGARNLDVHHGAFEEYAMQEGMAESLDGVLLMNVLEQTRDPIEVIRCCERVLAPGGALIIRSGNEFSALQEAACESLQKRQWWVSTPDQINYFSFDSMARLLEGEGFSVVDSWSDFPMEMFLLMGYDYVDAPGIGKECHERRVKFEMSLSPETRRHIYRSFATAGIGRCVFLVATKKS
ncbi:MAG: class I SAM-dependent methyltransferase [Myxococcales bacterium]|nr:class I SAM-dependent methyltransferase [Myxococcales bacterium]